MATFLLRLGRMCPIKCLQLESWGILRSQSVALFCTQAGDPAKPGKKTKAASKTAETSDERANLLAYKTTVAFPVRLSQPGVFPIQSLGVAEQVASSTATAETVVATAATVHVTAANESVVAVSEEAEAPAISSSDVEAKVDSSHITPPLDNTAVAASTSDDTVSTVTSSSEPGDLPAGESSSSSSSESESESDSDSDSDSEDEKSQVKTETQTSPPQLSESTVKKEAEVHKVPSEVKEDTNKDKEVPLKLEYTPAPAALQEATPTEVVETTAAGQATVGAPSISSDELVDSAPEICAVTGDTPEVSISKVSTEAAVKLAQEVREDISLPDAQTQTAMEVMTEPVAPEKAPIDVPTETPQPAAAEAPPETAPEESEAAAEVAADISGPGESAEELVDCASVTVAAGEKLQVEAGIEPSEEAAAVAPPEPEESFDNSTYKNYQHHSYTPYTFVDLDVEMAKFRLPQPSSGRPSPRH